MKIIAEIPARLGSKRVAKKNLRLFNGKPLISYAITAAKRANILSDIYVNSESDEFRYIADNYGVKFYKRAAHLAEDHVTSDQFNYDFIRNIKPDILVMINPVSPLITGKDIDNVITYFTDNKFDTVITVREERLHAFCDGKPINVNPEAPLPMTQDLKPIQVCCWSICVWRSDTFIKSFEDKGHAVFSGKLGFYPLSHVSSIKISTEEDFQLAEALMKCTHNTDSNLHKDI